MTVLGTPAEEGGGGKILLARRDAFTGADAVLLAHPAAEETVLPHLSAAGTLAVTMLGRAAHAGMYPERGVNALDALVLGYLGIAALRQHLAGTDRVHGVLTEGGRSPGVVPARAAGRFLLRSADRDGLARVRARVLACLAGGAEAAGARLVVRDVWPDYDAMRHNLPLAAVFERNVRALGRHPVPPEAIPAGRAGSTDLGTVSRLVPAIHPKLSIGPPDVVQHSVEFARLAAGPAADRAVLDGAKAMAMTAAELWLRPDLLRAVHAATGSPPDRPAGSRRTDPPAGSWPAGPAGSPLAGGPGGGMVRRHRRSGPGPAGRPPAARPGAAAAPGR